VLDIDSIHLNDFSHTDQVALEDLNLTLSTKF